MSQLKFVLGSAGVFVLYVILQVLGIFLFTDPADYLHDWTEVERDQHMSLLSLGATLMTAPAALPLLARRFDRLGWSRWWALLVFSLAVTAFLIGAFESTEGLISNMLLAGFGAALLGMMFGEQLVAISERSR